MYLNVSKTLTAKVPSKFEADNIHFLLKLLFSEKVRLDISFELFVMQKFHMKCQALFSLKIKPHTTQCCLLQFVISALIVNIMFAFVQNLDCQQIINLY